MDFADRRFDDASKTGELAHIQAHGFAAVVRDNQKALGEMLHNSPVRPHAPWNLIRPSIRG